MAGSLLTVGYGNRTLQQVIALLRQEAVQYLVDVRSSPRSKFNPEFSASPLDNALRDAGIRYVFMGDTLGGRPSDVTCYENGHVIYDLVQKRDFFQKGIERLLNALNQQLNVCLLCSETRPTDCHRSKLIGVALSAIGVDVIHLGQNGERVTQAEVIASLESLQGDLFGQSLRSRKSYGAKTMAAGRTYQSGPNGDD
jgi:uncharacterized protein (DUF488 family)